MLSKRDFVTLAIAGGASAATGIANYTGASHILVFVIGAVALAGLASLIGEATDHLGRYLSPAATGIVQSAVGNLPELCVCIFALRAGLIEVVQASLIGSILGNSLLVLGIAFIAGSVRHKVLVFDAAGPRMIAALLLLAVSALMLPTLASVMHLPAGAHEDKLALVCAGVLLLVFLVSVRVMLGGSERTVPAEAHGQQEDGWPLWLALTILALAGVAALFVSDWFVEALNPAIVTLGISQAFAGLVIVAIVGNAVENVVGIQFALRNQAELAISVILNSSLQVALALIPVLVFVSYAMGGTPFTLVIPPMLAVALMLSAIIGVVVTADGRADMADGAALVGLYVIIAAIFWWG
ncbi:sodium:proton exchanger [Labrys sp. ZIDIC5]|uniref:calcium:proton antiporter n=1 Tax=Labrys sedimenti TaxID=3106036 RepID=UPI002ACAFDEF|nr:sodium:proton exchanger [Labrys sp. ZIDIC5]MDZ5451708.1 sodium:proton exchanger [Labrys sp. ZIDIC5]